MDFQLVLQLMKLPQGFCLHETEHASFAVGTQSQSEQSRPVCVLLPVGLHVET